MDAETRKYFEDLDDMMGSPGWKRLVEDAKREIYELQADALEAPSYESLMHMRGRAETLARLVNLREVSDLTRAQHEEGDDDAAV